MSHQGRKPNTESIMNTSNNSLAEHLEKLARDMEYPPFNGGPTQEEIIGALKAAADVIGEYEYKTDEYEERADRVEELESAIEDAVDKADDILIILSTAVAAGELPECKPVEECETKLMEIISDLRWA